MYYNMEDIQSALEQDYVFVRVVRCRRCANYRPQGIRNGIEYGECALHDSVHENDYCIDGKLRGESDG